MLGIYKSFFKLLMFFRKSKIEFAVVFHSYHQDYELISKEFNYFVQGKHPLYNGYDENPLVDFMSGKLP